MQDSALLAQTGSLPWGVHVQFVAAELTWFFDYSSFLVLQNPVLQIQSPQCI